MQTEVTRVLLDFIVFGHTAEGKGMTAEISAASSAEAIRIAKIMHPTCKFNHANLTAKSVRLLENQINMEQGEDKTNQAQSMLTIIIIAGICLFTAALIFDWLIKFFTD